MYCDASNPTEIAIALDSFFHLDDFVNSTAPGSTFIVAIILDLPAVVSSFKRLALNQSFLYGIVVQVSNVDNDDDVSSITEHDNYVNRLSIHASNTWRTNGAILVCNTDSTGAVPLTRARVYSSVHKIGVAMSMRFRFVSVVCFHYSIPSMARPRSMTQ